MTWNRIPESETAGSGSFCRELMREPKSVVPTGWSIDWEGEPFRFKFYSDLPQIDLDSHIPLKLGRIDKPALKEPRAAFHNLSHFIFYSCGLYEIRREIRPEYSTSASADFKHRELASRHSTGVVFGPSAMNFFRGVPSGGALYPWEVYLVAGQGLGIQQGVFHYDPAHHRLDILREGNYLGRILMCINSAADRCSGLLILTTCFWKNYFKYANGSVRLHGLDAGVLAGQLLHLAGFFEFEADIVFQFLDRELAFLLGIDLPQEYVQIVVELRSPDAECPKRGAHLNTDSVSKLNPRIVKRKPFKSPPSTLLNIVTESLLDDPNSFIPPASGLLVPDPPTTRAYTMTAAPSLQPEVDLATVLLERQSGIDARRVSDIQVEELNAICQFATSGYPNDLDVPGEALRRIALACVVNKVHGIDPGTYFYKRDRHALHRLNERRNPQELQATYRLGNVNLSLASAVFFILTDIETILEVYGVRGFRFAHLEAGFVLQRLYMFSSALGHGVHALLGFEPKSVRRVLGIESTGLDVMVGVAVGARKSSAPLIRQALWS